MCNKSRIKFLSRSEAIDVAIAQTYFDNLTKTDLRIRGCTTGAQYLNIYISSIREFNEYEREKITSAVMTCDKLFRFNQSWIFMKSHDQGHPHTFSNVICLADVDRPDLLRVVMHERIHVYQRQKRPVAIYETLGYCAYAMNIQQREYLKIRSNPDADEFIYKVGDDIANARYRHDAQTIDDVYGLDHPNEISAYALVEYFFDGKATDFQLLLP